MQYINKKGKPVNVVITNHARLRFFERHNRIFVDSPIPLEKINSVIEKWWNRAIEKNVSKDEKLRRRFSRYGSDSIYFISTYFVFVVQNATIVTIELGSKDTRHLNKRDGVSPIKERRCKK